MIRRFATRLLARAFGLVLRQRTRRHLRECRECVLSVAPPRFVPCPSCMDLLQAEASMRAWAKPMEEL
jgi:hypothetical protein